MHEYWHVILEALVHNNIQVTLIEKNPQILNMFDADFAQMITDYIIGKNPGQVSILTNEEIIEFIGNEQNEVTKVITSSGREIETDFVVLGSPTVPNSSKISFSSFFA